MRLYKKRLKHPIIKYNPIYRVNGGYTKDEWTSISDLGEVYDGIEFKYEDYLKVEDLYVQAIFLALDFFKSKKVKITHIYKLAKKKEFKKYNSLELFDTFLKIEKDDIITDVELIDHLVRLRLREHIVALELTIDSKSRTEVIFGYDYYMYLKTNVDIKSLNKQIEDIGLFTDKH